MRRAASVLTVLGLTTTLVMADPTPTPAGAHADDLSRRTYPATYPAARAGDHVDDYFGTKVPDPYRWMEDVDSAEVAGWVAAENRTTAAYLAAVPGRAAMKDRLLALTDYERFGLPGQHGGRYFYRHNSGLQNQSVLFWQQGLDGDPHVLIDPNTLSKDGTVSLGGTDVTRDGKRIAYSTSDAGSDWQTWRVRDVETGADLPDVVERSKFSGASWAHDGCGFYYSGYAATGKDASLKAVNKFQKVYFHRLGTPQSADPVVFERPDDAEVYLGAGVSDDGRWLFVGQSKGDKNALAVVDLSRPAAPPVQVAAVADARYDAIDNVGATLFVLTNKDAANGKVVVVDLDRPDPAGWRTVVPEGKRRINGVSLFGDRLIVDAEADARTRVELWSKDGTFERELPLPGLGSAGGFGGRREDKETFFSFTNVQTPATVYRLDLTTTAVDRLPAAEAGLRPRRLRDGPGLLPEQRTGRGSRCSVSHQQGAEARRDQPDAPLRVRRVQHRR